MGAELVRGLWEGPTGKVPPRSTSGRRHRREDVGHRRAGLRRRSQRRRPEWLDCRSLSDDRRREGPGAGRLPASGRRYLRKRAGKISCIQRATPRTSIVTISGRDTAGPLEIDTAASRIDRINTIRPRYWSEVHRWQLTALPEVTASAYQTQDGGKRTRGIDYPYVTDLVQAAQLAALQIANTREGIAGVIPLKPHLQTHPARRRSHDHRGGFRPQRREVPLPQHGLRPRHWHRPRLVRQRDRRQISVCPRSIARRAGPACPHVGRYSLRREPPARRLDGHAAPTGDRRTQLPGFDLTGLVSNATATAILVGYGPSATGPRKGPTEAPRPS